MLLSAQDENPAENEIDSVRTNLQEDGIVLQDSIVKKERYLNPLAPSKAAFYSAVLPGLGQIYNKRYWKVPIVYGALGAGIYAYTFYNGEYQRFRTAFKRRRAGFADDEFINVIPLPGDDRLERLQNAKQNERDLALLVTIIIYALNIVDANVDAHLKQFNINDDLSWDMNLQPYLEANPIDGNPNYGMSLTLTF
ncbi:DUF5683 domain-containing protein [Maribacter sp. 2307UL18-2]|uniref:DUF5683 domain-containing protein n=1 Tax=Maribacter sp. 2307UL18-2 TaxID=3386274 RepID=UPI0039BD5EE1